MSQSIDEIQEEIVDEFALFDDWSDKYAYIIELGKKLVPLAEEEKKPELIIKGCQSNVWLKAGKDEHGNIVFTTDSDAVIVKGLVYLLVRVLSGHSASDIVNANISFIDDIGMRQHLSPTRSNGLASMLKQMKLYALAFQAQEKA